MRLRATLLGAVGLAVAATLGPGPQAAPASAVPLCGAEQSDVAPGSVLGQLEIGRAHRLLEREAPPARRPVAVAVVDSGVVGDAIPVAERVTIAGSGPVDHLHGTAVAGLIAGRPDGGRPVGIAPDARIVDVRVYDAEQPEDGTVVESANLAAGLEWVAREADRLNIRVANVSLVAPRSTRLHDAVRAVRRAGVVVVAAAGNRPAEGEPFDADFADDAPAPGEDAAERLFPTGYDDVVSVSATATGSGEPDAGALVLQNSNTTVAVPTFGAVTYGLDGRRCVLQPIGTSWAAAEVSGVLALLWQRYPDETDEQIVARLVATANGTADHRVPLVGAGVVQPYEALTRPLAPTRSGEVERTVTLARVSADPVAPEPAPDPLAPMRRDALWWGLVGGGVLVVALLLRPVLARRRRA